MLQFREIQIFFYLLKEKVYLLNYNCQFEKVNYLKFYDYLIFFLLKIFFYLIYYFLLLFYLQLGKNEILLKLYNYHNLNIIFLMMMIKFYFVSFLNCNFFYEKYFLFFFFFFFNHFHLLKYY